MSKREFKECPACAAKPRSPTLCPECIERRNLLAEVERLEGCYRTIREQHGLQTDGEMPCGEDDIIRVECNETSRLRKRIAALEGAMRQACERFRRRALYYRTDGREEWGGRELESRYRNEADLLDKALAAGKPDGEAKGGE